MSVLSPFFIRKCTYIIIWLGFALTFWPQPRALSQEIGTADQAVMTLGSAPVGEGGVAAAREKAIAGALRSAVEVAAARTLPLAGVVENFKAFAEFISGSSGEFIQGYKVLAEAETGGDYTVMVKATVAGGRLQESMEKSGILRSRRNMPRLLVLFLPDDGKGRLFVSPAHESIMAVLAENRFDIIKLEQVSTPQPREGAVDGILEEDIGGEEKSESGSARPVSLEQALSMAREARADVLVLGSLSLASIYTGGYENTTADTLMIIANTYLVGDGRQIASSVERVRLENPVSMTREAIREKAATVGNRVGESLALQLSQAWQEIGEDVPHFEVVVAGAQNLADFELFRRILRDVPQVKGVQTRERTSTLASLRVEYSGTVQELADNLALVSSESFRIRVTEVTPGILRVELIPR